MEKMIKDGAVKLVDREDIKELLLKEGWVVEGQEDEIQDDEEKPRRGRKPKDAVEE